MLKQLTIAALVGALLPACILTTDDTTTSDSASTTNVGTSTASTTDDPTSGTTATTVDDTTTAGTTTVATTTDGTTTDTPTSDGTTTVATTTDGTTTEATDATTGMGGAYGQCGWYAEDKYYACAVDGAEASLEDPDGISPIECAPGIEEGAKCSEEEGPVKGVGCCTPEGILYFCDSEGALTVIKQDCGA